MQSPQEGRTVAEAEPGFVDQVSFGTLHRERDRASRTDRVEPPFVAKPGRLQDDFRIVDSAQGAEREQVLVFQSDRGIPIFQTVEMFTADGTSHTRGPCAVACDAKFLGRNRHRAGKIPLLKIASRKHIQAIESQQVGSGSEFPVFGGGGSEGFFGQLRATPVPPDEPKPDDVSLSPRSP